MKIDTQVSATDNYSCRPATLFLMVIILDSMVIIQLYFLLPGIQNGEITDLFAEVWPEFFTSELVICISN